jgi:hypothetical protein
MDVDLKPCPNCGHPPKVYHGVYGGLDGESVECDRNECPHGDDDGPVWQYTDWQSAVKRWNVYVDAVNNAKSKLGL